MGNKVSQHGVTMEVSHGGVPANVGGGGGAGSFHGRETSFRRLKRWASSRVSLTKGGGCRDGRKQQQKQHHHHHQHKHHHHYHQHQHQHQPQREHRERPPREADAQNGFARKWNRESRKRIRRSTLFSKFASSKSKWPVPYIESLFLPDYPVRVGPQELDDFEVLDVIAAGSFGNVLKVRGDDTKKVYALKVIDKARLIRNGHAVVHQSKAEVSIQAALSRSSFVAPLLRHWQSRKRLYLLLEYFPNGELFALWKLHGRFSESLARLYIAELACALDFLHSCGVVFRDLKLENVVMDSQGHLVLIDFGLSKWLMRGQATRTLCGTLLYAAPEMLSGQPYDHCVDWWSLGVLFYALVTGKFPLSGARSCREMCHLVSRHDYETPSWLTWECRCTIEQLLQKSPARRLTSLSAVAQSPFFKGRINLDLVQTRALDPQSFYTQLDLTGRPDDVQRTAQRRQEEEILRLIDDSDEDTGNDLEDIGDECCSCCDECDDSFLVGSGEFYGTQL